MDFSLSPLIVAAVVGVVGIVQMLKTKLPGLPSWLATLSVSLFGAFGCATMTGIPALSAIQSLVLNWLIVAGAAVLSFETVVKRFTTPKEAAGGQT